MAALIHRLWCIPIQLLPIRQSSLLHSWEKILCCFVLPFRKADLSVSRLKEAEKAMATHSSTLAWKIPWMEEPGRLQSMGLLRVRHGWATSLSRIGEGNGNPLQCSCLENPRDGGAWWAAIYGVAQSWTWLRRLGGSSSRLEEEVEMEEESAADKTKWHLSIGKRAIVIDPAWVTE